MPAHITICSIAVHCLCGSRVSPTAALRSCITVCQPLIISILYLSISALAAARRELAGAGVTGNSVARKFGRAILPARHYFLGIFVASLRGQEILSLG